MKKLLVILAAALIAAPPAALAGVTALGFTKDFHGAYHWLEVNRDERLRGPVKEISEQEYYRDRQTGTMKKAMTQKVYSFDRSGNLQKLVTTQKVEGYPATIYTQSFDWKGGKLKRVTSTERSGDKPERVTEVTNFDHDPDGCVNYYEHRMYEAKPEIVRYECIQDGGRILRVNVANRHDRAEFDLDGNAVRVVYPNNPLLGGGSVTTEKRYKTELSDAGVRVITEENYDNGNLTSLTTRFIFSESSKFAGFIGMESYGSQSTKRKHQNVEYELDERGNWKSRSAYNLRDGEKYGTYAPEDLLTRTERKITYHK